MLKSRKLARGDAMLHGIIAAAYTPMTQDEKVDFAAIAPMIAGLRVNGVEGLFLCGSTGEGWSLSEKERMRVAECAVGAAHGQLPVVVHVGHNSLPSARMLARHAESLGVDAISAIAPGFFRPQSADDLVRFLGRIADAAPATPLYYYHFPDRAPTGMGLAEILQAGLPIANLAGVKYTHHDLAELTGCREKFGDRFHFVFGRDELFLVGLRAGFHDFIGSTYNYATPLFLALRDAFRSGHDAESLRLQALVDELLALLVSLPPFAGQKILLPEAGIEAGPSRCPLPRIDADVQHRARQTLRAILDRTQFSPAPNATPAAAELGCPGTLPFDV
jgi:N-acetylneuraminate lyase